MTQTVTVISRDPFAREELVRVTDRFGGTCAACGSRPGRFRYGVSPDSVGARTSWDARTFCSVECRRSFYI